MRMAPGATTPDGPHMMLEDELAAIRQELKFSQRRSDEQYQAAELERVKMSRRYDATTEELARQKEQLDGALRELRALKETISGADRGDHWIKDANQTETRLDAAAKKSVENQRSAKTPSALVERKPALPLDGEVARTSRAVDRVKSDLASLRAALLGRAEDRGGVSLAIDGVRDDVRALRDEASQRGNKLDHLAAILTGARHAHSPTDAPNGPGDAPYGLGLIDEHEVHEVRLENDARSIAKLAIAVDELEERSTGLASKIDDFMLRSRDALASLSKQVADTVEDFLDNNRNATDLALQQAVAGLQAGVGTIAVSERIAELTATVSDMTSDFTRLSVLEVGLSQAASDLTRLASKLVIEEVASAQTKELYARMHGDLCEFSERVKELQGRIQVFELVSTEQITTLRDDFFNLEDKSSDKATIAQLGGLTERFNLALDRLNRVDLVETRTDWAIISLGDLVHRVDDLDAQSRSIVDMTASHASRMASCEAAKLQFDTMFNAAPRRWLRKLASMLSRVQRK